MQLSHPLHAHGFGASFGARQFGSFAGRHGPRKRSPPPRRTTQPNLSASPPRLDEDGHHERRLGQQWVVPAVCQLSAGNNIALGHGCQHEESIFVVPARPTPLQQCTTRATPPASPRRRAVGSFRGARDSLAGRTTPTLPDATAMQACDHRDVAGRDADRCAMPYAVKASQSASSDRRAGRPDHAQSERLRSGSSPLALAGQSVAQICLAFDTYHTAPSQTIASRRPAGALVSRTYPVARNLRSRHPPFEVEPPGFRTPCGIVSVRSRVSCQRSPASHLNPGPNHPRRNACRQLYAGVSICIRDIELEPHAACQLRRRLRSHTD